MVEKPIIEVPIIPYHRPMVRYKESHILSNGPRVALLEELVKELYDVEYVIACASCTIGLMIVLDSYRIYDTPLKLPAFEWFSVQNILHMMDIPQWYVDIDPRTWNIADTEDDYMLVNHTFGNICEGNDSLIYDGAHAFGAEIEEFGEATVFSLAPTKVITSMEGGLILTNNEELAGKYSTLRDRIGRMSEPNADWGLYTLENLEEILEWKQYCYHYYKKSLPGIFQEIPIASNYNTIGMLTNLKVPPHIECRKYYHPLNLGSHLKCTKFVYNKIVCLPSWFGVDIEKIVEDILQYNEDLDHGRVRVFGESHYPAPPGKT